MSVITTAPDRHHRRPRPAPQGVSKLYGTGDAAVAALDNVSVGLGDGEFTAIMGPSGSGKSTLLHMLAGLDRPTSGEVFLGDTEITSLNDKALTLLRRDQIGFIFQSFNLLPDHDRGGEHRAADPDRRPQAGRASGSRRSSRPSASTEPARRTGRPQLSGGQQQRVAAARALASRPQIVFADEPTGALDSRSGAELLGFLRKAVNELGQTVVMVTHDADRGQLRRPRPLPRRRPRSSTRCTTPTADAVLDYMKHLGA